MKVSNLTVAGALSAGDLFYLVQGTSSRKLALSSLSSYILTGGFTASLGATTVTSLTSSGAIAANGGTISTTVTTFNLVDTTVTTLNLARAATAITLGATTGTTTVRNNLTVSGGTVTATSFTGNASTATTLQTARTISLSGDVTGSVSFNGGANVDIVATIAANSVALGTDTTGNYVATITGTADRITVTGSGAENAAVTLNVDATSANTANKVVARDASGNFSAGTISATAFSGGSFTGTTLTASGLATLNGGISTTTISYTGEVLTNATSALQIPTGSTAQRPTGLDGKIRYNNTLNRYEGYSTAAASWGSLGGGATGGGADTVFVENSQVVTTNYTITSGKSASSAGPITINNGVTVTVPSGSRWVIL